MMRCYLLVLLLLVVSAPLAAAQPVDEAALIKPFPYAMTQVAPEIYAWIETGRPGVVSSNIVAVIGDDGVLVFDTGHHPPVTRRIVAELKKLTRKPVRYVVNSHWHEDHFAGNAEFADAWPGAVFIAHRFTAQMLDSRRERFRGEPCAKEASEQAQDFRKMLDSGKRPDGSALSDRSREFLKQALAELDAHAIECRLMRYRGSDLAFDDALDIHLGKRVVKLLWLGRANTAGDAIAYVPDAKVLLTGDVLVAPFPFATQSYIREWAVVLRKLEDMDTAAIVPGHGAVMRDKTYLADIRAVLESLSAQVHAAYKPGVGVDEVRQHVDLSVLRQKICGDDKFVLANFDNMILQSGVERAYQQEQGQLKPEGDE
jgi:cyclase